MKRLIVAALCAFGFASLYGEQMNYWLYADGKITDGAWTFSATADKNNNMTVGQVSETAGEYPTVPTPLDFSKPVKDASENSYVITTLDCRFVNSSGYVARTPAQYVSALTLPGEGLTRLSDYCLGKLVSAVGTLHFPSSLTSIGRMAFADDSNLTVEGSEFANVTVLTWGDAFKNVNVIGELDLRKVSGKIENNNFANTKITAVRFGPELTELQGGSADGAFAGCTKLKSVIFDPDSSVTVGKGGVFRGCTALEEIDLRAVKTLTVGGSGDGYAPFGICTGLKKVVLGGKMEQWDNVVFAGCSSLSEVHYYGAPCTSIGTPVFKNAGDSRVISTFVHLNSSDDTSKAAWGAYTADGELNENDSCWKSDMIIGSTGELRPLVLYTQKHVSLARGVDGDMEHGVIGTFIVSRAEDDSLAGAVDVAYTLSGTAVNGVDYEKLSGVISIPGGERSVELQVIPRFVGAVSTKDVTVTLDEGDYEIVSGKDSATINVSSCYRSVSVAKLVDADEGKGTYGYFEISRGENDAVTAPLEVSFEVSGTARPGTTYRAFESPVVISAGERSVKIRVTPLDDSETTTDTTVIVTVTGDNYAIEGGLATMTIVNGATFGGWKAYDAYMTDGTWKFMISLRDTTFAEDSTTYELWLQDCAEHPAEVSTVDFSKVILNVSSNKSGRNYAISKMDPEFASKVNGKLQDAGNYVGSVVLPDDGHKYAIGDHAFDNLPYLTSVTPFLPKSCKSLTGESFKGYKGSKELVFYGEEICLHETSRSVFEGCAITNADLSASTITGLRRDCFANCTELKEVKLPPTIKEFGAPHASDLATYNRSPFGGVGGVKLIFTGGALPVMTCADSDVAAIEFTTPVAELPDNAFANYRNPYVGTKLTSITFVGPPPATIGSDIFSGGYKDRSITVNVPIEYIDEWREIADNKVLTKEDGGTWTSGTTQLINVYGEVKVRQGLLIIVR